MTPDAYSFELSWRWTQPTHNVLPPEVMAQITPLARSLVPDGLMVRDQLNRPLFEEIRSFPADSSMEEVGACLRQLPIAQTERVAVRWDERTAVETTWEIFAQYWDDFCYPSSDDVEIFPASAPWILVYHHYELFEWGLRRQFD
ncbi:MAG TPA: hypothetical protein VIL86_09195 [Tepidisphaeraceae bacterium]|jgi:hypothetical protein